MHNLLVLVVLVSSIATLSTGSLLGTVGGILNPIIPILPPPAPPPSNTYTSYVLNPVCNPSVTIQYPQSTDDVQAIVRGAIANKTTVKAFGNRHSATDIICTNGIPVDMRGLQSMQFNPADNTVTVGAGVYLRDAGNFMQQHGRGLRTTPGFGHITIAGAVGTGAHGSSIKYNSSISEQVVGMTIVDGLGNIQSITSEDDLHAFRLHLGLLGMVVDVTLATVPLYKVTAHNYVVDDSILTDGSVIGIIKAADQMSLYWFPTYGKVVIANWSILADVTTPGNAYTFDHVPSTTTVENLAFHAAFEEIQATNSIDLMNTLQALMEQTLLVTTPYFVPIYTEDGVTVENPATGFYHLMFAPICNSTGDLQCPWFHSPNNITFLDNEMSFDLAKLPAVAATVKDILAKSPAVFPVQGILLRFSASSTTYMSTAYSADTCHFEWYTVKRNDPYENASMGLAAYQTMMQSMVSNYSGRSHWGKSGLYYHTKAVIAQKLNPTAKSAFLAKMSQYDPNGVFMNDFGRRLKGVSSVIDTDPLTKHCALLDNCVCSTSADCATGQICTTLAGYPNYPVCQTLGLLPAPLDPNPIVPPSLIDWIISIVGTLDGALVGTLLP